jgi:hypothetical protein
MGRRITQWIRKQKAEGHIDSPKTRDDARFLDMVAKFYIISYSALIQAVSATKANRFLS